MRSLIAFAAIVLAGCTTYDRIRTDSTLFSDLGGEAGVQALARDTIDLAHANPAIRRHFEKIDREDLKTVLAEQFCALSGGPCVYKGKDMAKAHKGLDLSEADFNALVEDLRRAFDRNETPESARNRLLALLAPMKREMLHR